MVYSGILSTTPALPRLLLPCWTLHFVPVKPPAFSPSHYLLVGGIILPILAKPSMMRTSLGSPCGYPTPHNKTGEGVQVLPIELGVSAYPVCYAKELMAGNSTKPKTVLVVLSSSEP